MLFSKKTLVATAAAAAAMVSASAFAGASLDSLLGGGSLFSSNGLLEFSEFQFDPIINAPSAADIDVATTSSGIRFGSNELFSDSTLGGFDFEISYKVTGVGALINGVAMRTTGSATADGRVGIFKTVENTANLTNIFSSSSTLSNTSASFDPLSEIYVFDDIFATPKTGTAGLSDFTQTYSTTTAPKPTAIPSPTAALAGLALLGAISLRRRRQS